MKPWEAYFFLGHCLNPHAPQPALPAETAWPSLVALGSRHLLLPGLSTALHHRGLAARLPTDLLAHLDSLHALNSRRNHALRAELLHLVRLCNDLGFSPLALKGAISLVEPLYPRDGDRMMSDLDLLIPEDRLADCLARLHREGWTRDHDIPALLWRDKHHAPPLFHQDFPAALELHTHGLGASLRHLLPTGEFWTNSIQRTVDGVTLGIPAPMIRLRHNLLHTQLSDRNHQRVRLSLRQLWEWVSLRQRFQEELDWQAFARAGIRPGILDAYLLAAQTLFAQPLPESLSTGADGRRAHTRLERALRHPGYGKLLAAWADTGHFFRVRLPHLVEKLPAPAWWSYQWRSRIKNRRR